MHSCIHELHYTYNRFQLDQMAIDCCIEVPLMLEDTDSNWLHVVEGALLLQSGDVSTVLGLTALYQFISRSTLCDVRYTSQAPMVNYFTTVVFTRYLLTLIYTLYDDDGDSLTELAMKQYATSIRSTEHLNCADLKLFAMRSERTEMPSIEMMWLREQH